MTGNRDGYFLPPHQQTALSKLLWARPDDKHWRESIPSLVEDLAVTIARQDKFGGGGPRVSQGETVQPLPFSESASVAADALNGTLRMWVRRTCTSRKMDWPPSADTLTLARWLDRWIIALALTPDAHLAPGQILAEIRNCRRICDRPMEKPLPVTDEEKVAEADNWLLNVNGLAHLAREMGDQWLTKKRINTLMNKGHVLPIGEVAGQNLYRVGDVRQAHAEVRCVARENHYRAEHGDGLEDVI